MSDLPPGDNRGRHLGGAPVRHAVLAAVGLAWVVTMAQLVRTEVLAARESPDVRAVVESARLTREHASARYVVRARETVIGTLASTVSGSRDEEQLAYVVEGELHAPLRARLKAVVIATWDRKPERLVLDLDLGGVRHRVDGELVVPAGTFRVRYLAPGADAADAPTWDIPDVPVLASGPLPLPQVAGDAFGAEREGEITDPATGRPLTWQLHGAARESITLGGRLRRTLRHELVAGGVTVTAWTEDNGFPLRVELPGGIVIELADEAPAPAPGASVLPGGEGS